MIDGVVPPYLAYNGKYLVQVLSDGLCGFKHYYFDSKEEAHKRFEEIVLENRFYSVTYGIYHNQRDVTIKPDHLVNLFIKSQGGIMATATDQDKPCKDPNYPIQKYGFKDENEEIQYLGQMITATRIEDKQRLGSIADRLRFFATGCSPAEPTGGMTVNKEHPFFARFKPTDIASVVLGTITIKNCVVRSVSFYEGEVFYDMLAPVSDTGWVEINHVDSAVVTFN